jgi:hypothetical protein
MVTEAESAGLEGAGRVVALFFHVDGGKTLAAEHGRPTLGEGDGFDRRQNGSVAPHARGRAICCGMDDVARVGASERGEVIADVKGARGKPGAALRADGADGLG